MEFGSPLKFKEVSVQRKKFCVTLKDILTLVTWCSVFPTGSLSVTVEASLLVVQISYLLFRSSLADWLTCASSHSDKK